MHLDLLVLPERNKRGQPLSPPQRAEGLTRLNRVVECLVMERVELVWRKMEGKICGHLERRKRGELFRGLFLIRLFSALIRGLDLGVIQPILSR